LRCESRRRITLVRTMRRAAAHGLAERRDGTLRPKVRGVSQE
jgi:hypothetical protein